MGISVIIPTLNEAEALPRLIASLRQCGGIAEIIVSDGGSTDGTREWCRQQQDVHLADSRRGKGPQLNAGAAVARGDLLLFLHADCLLNPEALSALQTAMKNPRFAGGAFYIRFAEETPRALRLVERGINFRTALTRRATGDQGIFVRRQVFATIGGAPEWPLFEDVELVRRIRSAGGFVTIREPLIISGRRYAEQGVIRTTLLIYVLRLGYWVGFSPQTLKRWFADVR